MPSFETDVVLRALIEGKLPAAVGPSYLGPAACAEFARQLNVSEVYLWGAICNLRENGRIEDVRSPEGPGMVILMPTSKGEAYFARSSRKQPYPRDRCRRTSSRHHSFATS